MWGSGGWQPPPFHPPADALSLAGLSLGGGGGSGGPDAPWAAASYSDAWAAADAPGLTPPDAHAPFSTAGAPFHAPAYGEGSGQVPAWGPEWASPAGWPSHGGAGPSTSVGSRRPGERGDRAPPPFGLGGPLPLPPPPPPPPAYGAHRYGGGPALAASDRVDPYYAPHAGGGIGGPPPHFHARGGGSSQAAAESVAQALEAAAAPVGSGSGASLPVLPPAALAAAARLDSRGLASVIKALARSGHASTAAVLFDWLRGAPPDRRARSAPPPRAGGAPRPPGPAARPDVFLFTAAISACLPSRDVDRAMDLAGAMRADGVSPNTHTYTALMNVCLKVS